MIAIIVSEDQYLRKTMSLLLNQLGYQPVLATDHVDEASYFFSKYHDQIKLILFESTGHEGSDLPLSRLVIQNSELNFIPLIYISNHSETSPFFSFHQRQLSRIDQNLSKPFGIRQLQSSIAQAHRRRALLRNRLLVIGPTPVSRIAESIYVKRYPMHWKELLSADTIESLQNNLKENAFRIGGILVDPKSEALATCLSRYKKTAAGQLTPIAILGSTPKETTPFRNCGDLFYDIEGPRCDELLSLVSKRIIYGWDIRDILLGMKDDLKKDSYKKAEKRVLTGLELDHDRWELLKSYAKICEHKGDWVQAKLYYEQALASNPCDPSSYLAMVAFLQGEEKKQLLTKAKSYCTTHPQIQKMSEHE